MTDRENYTNRRHHHHHHHRSPERASRPERSTPEELKALNEGLREAVNGGEPDKTDTVYTTGKTPGTGTTGRKKQFHRSSSRRRSGHRKKITAGKVVLTLLAVLAGIILVAGASFLVLQRIGAGRLLKQEEPEEPDVVRMSEAAQTDISYEEGVIRYNGEKYRYNKDLTTILFMGIDRSVQAEDNQNVVIGETGQADTLLLGVVDNHKKKITLINISRDTIASVARYNTDGEYVDLMDMQICLAYAFGDGQEKSCENVVRAVSDYFYGIPISSYAAIDYEGIGVLTDVVGGVDVKVPDDYFAERYPEMSKGNTVTLNGRQAITFVRSRDSFSYEANNGRMQRQKQFLLGLIRKTLAATRRNLSIPLSLYNSVSDYTVTDLTAAEITYLASKAVQYGFSENNMRSIAGEIAALDEKAAFYADEKKFYELVLEVFYNKE